MINNKVLQYTLYTILSILLIAFAMWGIPKYTVYSKTLKGKAALEEAKYDRMIIIEEAEAGKGAATHRLAEDTIRAHGTARAVAIIDKQLTTPYIQWLWVKGLHDGTSETIYIPTEANMPILEATRRQKKIGVPSLR